MLAVDRPVSADAASGRLCDAAGGGYAIGDRSEVICRRLWQAIPAAYRTCRSYSDYWAAYAQVWPSATHRSVGKHEGQTNHVHAGTTPYAKPMRVMSARPLLFPSLTIFMSWSLASLLFAIIKIYHLLLDHYQNMVPVSVTTAFPSSPI